MHTSGALQLDMPRIIQATIVTPTGARVEGVVANLTSTGLFLRTADELRFGQSVTVKLLSHSIAGQVLFVSSEPKGVVLSLRASAEARTTILTTAPDVEVLAPPPAESPEVMWADGSGELPAKLDTGDLEIVVPTTNPEETPLDVEALDDTLPPDAQLPVIGDGALGDSTEREEVEELDSGLLAAAVNDDLRRATEAIDDVSSPFDPAEPEIPILDPTDAAMDLDLPTDPDAGGMPAPALELVETPAPTPPTADASLPTLDSDGYTVRFVSADSYQVQYKANIEHGGLVVAADALPIGTQRMLALEVPGSAAYTVSARVIYHQNGRLGFMLDSFNIHKARLSTLAS